MDELLKNLAAILGLEGDSISEDAIKEAVVNLKAQVDAVKENVDAPAETNTPEALVEAVEDKIEKEVASQQKKATASAKNPDPSKYVGIEVVTELQKQVADLQGSEQDRKATAAVDEALKAGKIIPAQRDWAMAYASQDPKGFAAYVEKAPALVKDTGTGRFQTELASTEATADESKIAAQLGISTDALRAEQKK